MKLATYNIQYGFDADGRRARLIPTASRTHLDATPYTGIRGARA